MNHSRFSGLPHRTAFFALLIAAIALAACGAAPNGSWPGLTTTDDAIYVAFGQRVVALDPASGARLWEYPDKDHRDATFFAAPVFDDGTIYVGDYKGRVHAINQDGTEKWIYTPEHNTLIGPLSLEAPDRVIGGVAVSGERIFAGLGSRDVIALDRETGALDWTFETEHGVWAKPLYLPEGPQTGAGSVYVVSLDHHFYALDPVTGDKLWSEDLGGAAPGNMLYDEARNRIYVGTFISELVAIDLEAQEIVDRYETEGWLWDNPALVDDTLYFGDLSGFVYAVRITDDGFARDWMQPVSERAIRGTPVVTDDLVIVGSRDKSVYALTRDSGAAEWTAATNGEVLTDLVAVPNEAGADGSELVLVGTTNRDALLVALASASGEESWSYSDGD